MCRLKKKVLYYQKFRGPCNFIHEKTESHQKKIIVKGWFHILIHLLHEISAEICVKEILVTQEIPRKDESDMHLDMNEV